MKKNPSISHRVIGLMMVWRKIMAFRALLAEKRERLKGIKMKFQNEPAKDRIGGKRSITAHAENQNANIL